MHCLFLCKNTSVIMLNSNAGGVLVMKCSEGATNTSRVMHLERRFIR